jgi:hypothetical protein|nr:MAG TPA: hypothetical protein [Caudoviricetes sp.]
MSTVKFDTDGHIDKISLGIEAAKHLDLQGKNFAEALVLAWVDGFDHALDLCVQLEQRLDDADMRDQLEERADGVEFSHGGA